MEMGFHLAKKASGLVITFDSLRACVIFLLPVQKM